MMSRLITLWRIMLAGGRNFFRNAWLTVAATAVMVVTLVVMLSAVIFNLGLNETLDEVRSQIDIAIFFNDNINDQVVEDLQQRLVALEDVESTYFVSQDEALARYREQNQDNPDLLEGVSEEENELPTSLEVEVSNLENIEPIRAIVSSEEFAPYVDEASYEDENNQRTVSRIASTSRFLVQTGIVSSLIFMTISILIIFNTIRMAIFSRGEELQIMRLIGATNGYIRGPFIFEAMLDGIIAAVIALGVTYGALFNGVPRLADYVNVTQTLNFFQAYWPLIVLATVLTGVLIGVLSSVLAMMRYLKL